LNGVVSRGARCEKLIRLYCRQPEMLAIEDKQFIDFVGPEFMEGRFLEYLFYFVAVGGVERYPDALCFHADGVLIDHFFVDQEVDIGTVSGHEVHEVVGELEFYRYLEFHYNNDKSNLRKLKRRRVSRGGAVLSRVEGCGDVARNVVERTGLEPVTPTLSK
jgi:hypothetical protein